MMEPIKVTYSADGDALYLYFVTDPKVARTKPVTREVLLDFDAHDQLVGMEILGFKAGQDIDDVIQRCGLDPKLVDVLDQIRRLISTVPVRKELVLA